MTTKDKSNPNLVVEEDKEPSDQAYRCMAGLPQTRELIGLKVPYGAWEPDTLITDTFGNPMFSVLDVQHHAMGSFEAIFGDENGHKLAYVKRRLITNYYNDGWDFCTYKPNFKGQPRYKERDMYGKSVFPFSFLHIRPMRCRYEYAVHRDDLEGTDTIMHAMHGWLGSMTVCCTPMVRFGKWQVEFHRPGAGDPELNIDQSKNLLEVERGNDLLAALCIAYAFDKALCQPLVTIIGYEEKEHLDDDDDSLDSFDPEDYGAAAAGAPRGIDAPPPDDDAYREYDEPPQVDGYLEAPPAYHDDEPDGYLQDNAYDNPPVSRYLDSGAYDEGYEEPAGYIDGGEGYDENAGYIDDGGGYDYGDGYDNSQEDGNLIEGYEYDNTTYDGTIDSGYDARQEGMQELD